MVTPKDVFRSRILVVDDHPGNVMLLRGLLAQDGYGQVRDLSDSREVLSVVEAWNPDLILLDLHMPHVDARKGRKGRLVLSESLFHLLGAVDSLFQDERLYLRLVSRTHH